jgi:hypothetical protein
MDLFGILATVMDNSEPAAAAHPEGIVPIDLIWEQVKDLNAVEALTFVSFGVVCLFYGWRVFKVLVVISFTLFGLVGGIVIGDIIGGGNNPVLGVLLAVVLAIVSVPLMRWAVCLLGAAAGGLLTASIWYAALLPEQYIWMGALVGIVAGGMISFIVFRIAVMLFSSLGGSVLAVSGVLAMLYMYSQTQAQIEELVFSEKWFLPVALIIPTLVGVLLQNKFIKGSQDWSV